MSVALMAWAMIVDATVILSAFFLDEAQEPAQALIRDHVVGQVRLAAPTLLLHEVTNAVLQARRKGRIGDEQTDDILSSFERPGIVLEPVTWQQILPLAVHLDRSAYDAAHLALAEVTEQRWITGGSRMYNAVREHLDYVEWIGYYPRSE